jgi:hypothetical protein
LNQRRPIVAITEPTRQIICDGNPPSDIQSARIFDERPAIMESDEIATSIHFELTRLSGLFFMRKNEKIRYLIHDTSSKYNIKRYNLK